MKQVRYGYCEALTLKLVRDTVSKVEFRDTLQEAEELLHFFHWRRSCLSTVVDAKDSSSGRGRVSAAAGQLPAALRVQFLANLDKDVFAAAFGASGVQGESELAPRVAAVVATCGRHYQRLQDLCQRACPGACLLPFPGQLPQIEPPKPAAPKTQEVLLQPEVLQLSKGALVNEAATVVEGHTLEQFAWSQFMETTDALSQLDDDAARSAVVTALASLRRQLGDAVHQQLSILKGGQSKQIRVVAAKSLQKGELKLAPLVQGALRVSTTGLQGNPPEVRIVAKGMSRSMYLCGSSSFPPRRGGRSFSSVEEWSRSSAGADGSDAAAISDHEWKASHFPWPFWQIQRREAVAGTNCHLEAVTMLVALTSTANGWGEPLVDAVNIDVPIITNTMDVEKGDELIVHWPNNARSAKRTQQQNCNIKTWADQAAKRAKTK